MRPIAKGWCPGAYQPMMSGDGLVVRVRPLIGRMTADQVVGLCDAADQYGSGVLDLTSRANIQIRGVAEANYETLLEALKRLDLLPDDPELEARRNILVQPFWREGDVTYRLATELTARLAELPALPAKFGFAVDTGEAPILHNTSADIRLEHGSNGVIMRADGASTGMACTAETAVDTAIDLAKWFVSTGGTQSKRMARHIEKMPLPDHFQGQASLPPKSPPQAGPSPSGTFYGAPFGQIAAGNLRELAKRSGLSALRMTPWRLALTEDAAPCPSQGFIIDPNDPTMRANACPGSPLCASATVETRKLATELAQKTQKTLHVSGCAKGCAHPRHAEITLVGANGRFDLVQNGLPWDEPEQTGLTPDQIRTQIGEL